MAESKPTQRRKPYWWKIPNHKRAQPYQQNVHIQCPSPTAGGGVVTGGKVTKY